MWICPRWYSQPALLLALLHLCAGRGGAAAACAPAPTLPGAVLSRVVICAGLPRSAFHLHRAAARYLSDVIGATIGVLYAADHTRSAPSQPANGPLSSARADRK